MIVFGKRNLNQLKNTLSEIVYLSFTVTSLWILPIYKVEIKYCPTNRKRAKWVRCPELDDIYYSYCHCSNCGFVANKKHNYCVCGAVMEE